MGTSTWGSSGAIVHVANAFSDRKIYVVAMPNPDWAWADVGAMVLQFIAETAFSVLTAGAAAPAQAVRVAATAARLSRLAQGLNSIKRVIDVVRELKAFKTCMSAFDVGSTVYSAADILRCSVSAAEANALQLVGSQSTENLRAYLEQNAVVIKPNEFTRVNDVSHLAIYNALNPSYWGAISGCSTVQLLVVDEKLDYACTFLTGPDDSWIVNPDRIVHARYGSIWQEDAATATHAWSPPAPPPPPELPYGDCIIGVGTDNKLWGRVQVTSPWIEMPLSGIPVFTSTDTFEILTSLIAYSWNETRPAIQSIAALPDASLLAVSNKVLWVKSKPSCRGWWNVPNSGDVLAAVALPDGTIAAVGMDNALWTRPSLLANWVRAPENTVQIKSLAVQPNGVLIAVGVAGDLWTRATINSPWQKVNQDGIFLGVTTMPDGAIVGVGTDKKLWTQQPSTGKWTQVYDSGLVTAIAYVPPPPELIGVGTDGSVYTRKTLTSDWVKVPTNATLSFVTGLPDGGYLGVGVDKQLWTCHSLSAPWEQIPGSGDVLSVTALPDGSVVGVGTDRALWQRKSLKPTDPWSRMAGTEGVKSIVSLADRSLMGISATNGALMKWTDGRWEEIPNSTEIDGVTVLRNGTIVALGTDQCLWKWAGGWQQVPNSGLVKSIYAPR